MSSSSSSRRFPVFAALALGAQLLFPVACATAPVAPEQEPPPPPSPRPPFNPVAFAAQFQRPAECEAAAREIQVRSREDAWAGLKACVDKGNFLALRQLVAGWLPDLQNRPDAPTLLAKVIAMRGGDITDDLQLLHEQHIPLFTLDDGISQPDLYTGRYVVFRAKVEEMRADGGTFTAKLQELALKSEEWDVQVGAAHRRTVRHHGSNVQSGGGPGGPAPGHYSEHYQGGYDEANSHTVKRYDNVTVETGHEALARLPRADPFLEPGKEFIVLARFDGVRTTSGSGDEEEPEVVPVLTLVSFQAPNALVIH